MKPTSNRSAPPRARGLIEALENSFREALRTPEGTAEPAVLIWPDADGQWRCERTRAGDSQRHGIASSEATYSAGPGILGASKAQRSASAIGILVALWACMSDAAQARQAKAFSPSGVDSFGSTGSGPIRNRRLAQ